MNARQQHMRTWFLVGSVALALPLQGSARLDSDALRTKVQRTLVAHDGQHNFDFEIGAWKTHLRRLQHPLSGSSTWVEYEGTTVVRKVWDGRANLVELEVDGPTGHIEALSLRLYNSQSHQWSLNFANSAGGTLGVPTIGGFRNGRGEFVDQEQFNGRAILVRFIISQTGPDSCHFEQAFSDDGGKTWETNWIANDTRVAGTAGPLDAEKNLPASGVDRQTLRWAFRTGVKVVFRVTQEVALHKCHGVAHAWANGRDSHCLWMGRASSVVLVPFKGES